VNRRRTLASSNRAHAGLADYLERKLQNPEFRAAYEAEDKRIKLMIETFRLRRDRARSVADA